MPAHQIEKNKFSLIIILCTMHSDIGTSNWLQKINFKKNTDKPYTMKLKLVIVSMLTMGTSILNFSFAQSEQKKKASELNVVYGDKHIFTIETPEGWINDKKNAQKIGLVNFFYAKSDASIKQKSYMYANGYDKDTVNYSLEEFIKGDLETYQKKYPDYKYEIVKIAFTGGVRNGKLYSFSNLKDRYKEEVLYAETESTIIVFSFSATIEKDYKNYQSVFDAFVKSFNYRGGNPKPFLDYMNKNKQMFKW